MNPRIKNRTRDREIWRLRHDLCMTNSAIARLVGISPSKVRLVLMREPNRQHMDALNSPFDPTLDNPAGGARWGKTHRWTAQQQEEEICREREGIAPKLVHGDWAEDDS